MKNLKINMIVICSILFSSLAFAQVGIIINKPISEGDKVAIQKILKSFDSNSYKINVKTEKGVLKSGMAKGLTDVRQGSTVRPQLDGNKASTNTNINLFKSSAASTNTNINIFKSNAASTNTNINIFKQGKFNENQLTQLDKLHGILSKYQ